MVVSRLVIKNCESIDAIAYNHLESYAISKSRILFGKNISNTEYRRLQDELRRTNQSPLGMLWTGSNDPYVAFRLSAKGSYAKILLDPLATRADVYFGPEVSHFVTQ